MPYLSQPESSTVLYLYVYYFRGITFHFLPFLSWQFSNSLPFPPSYFAYLSYFLFRHFPCQLFYSPVPGTSLPISTPLHSTYFSLCLSASDASFPFSLSFLPSPPLLSYAASLPSCHSLLPLWRHHLLFSPTLNSISKHPEAEEGQGGQVRTTDDRKGSGYAREIQGTRRGSRGVRVS